LTNTEFNIWQPLMEMGREDGHLLAVCPDCRERHMIGYESPNQLIKSGPRCRCCRPDPPRLLLLSDADIPNKKPGEVRGVRLLEASGCIVRPGAMLTARALESVTNKGYSIKRSPESIGTLIKRFCDWLAAQSSGKCCERPTNQTNEVIE
jgi:hypothetical protein